MTFGEAVRNRVASETNPERDGFYVETIYRHGKLNPGKWYRITDGKGRFWLSNPDHIERRDDE